MCDKTLPFVLSIRVVCVRGVSDEAIFSGIALTYCAFSRRFDCVDLRK